MITRTDILAHLERNIRTGFLLGRSDYTPLRSAFMGSRPSDGAFEDYADMGTVPWPRQNAGVQGDAGLDARTGAVQVGAIGAGGPVQIIGAPEQSMRIYNVDWEIGIGITHNAIDDDQAGDLEGWARSARAQFERHMDFVAFDMLNNGASGATYGNGYDQLSFFNDAHIDPGAEYQTGQDNSFALALSLDNFETVKVASSKFLDDRGQPFGLNHNLLIVPADLEYLAFNITKNQQAQDTSNRELNPYAGYNMIVAPGAWLDSTSWFLLDPSLPQKPLYMQERQAPELVMVDDETQGSGVRYFFWRARYNGFYGDWRTASMGNT